MGADPPIRTSCLTRSARPDRRSLPSVVAHADADQVTAFRLHRHALSRRLLPGSLLVATAASGIEDAPPGSAAVSLAARVDALEPGDLDRALAFDRSLVRLWSVRAAPVVVPTADAAVFTTGVRPDDESSRRFFILGAAAHLDTFGLTATDAAERTAAALLEVLDGRELTKDELGRELAAFVGRSIPAHHLASWNAPDGLRLNRHGESLVRWVLGLVSLDGLFVLSARRGSATRFLRTDQWLGAPFAPLDPAAARAELARRYLRCFGPSTTGDLAAWAGISPAQAGRSWRLVEAELVEVRVGRRTAWLLASDLEAFAAPPQPTGVRLLPPHDPFLQLRDRATLLPDPSLRSRVWRAQGAPGGLIVAGRLLGTWRGMKRGRRLSLTIDLFDPLRPTARDDLVAEAQIVARTRECATAEVSFEG